MCVWYVSLHLALERPEVLTYCESLIYYAEAAAAALPPSARTHARYNKPVRDFNYTYIFLTLLYLIILCMYLFIYCTSTVDMTRHML